MPPQDPELKAVASVMRTLDPLSKDSQRRVMNYVSERLRADVRFDLSDLMANVTEAFTAINQTARELGITGAQLVGVVLAMYNEAKESNAVNEDLAHDDKVQPPGGPELQSSATPEV